VKKRKRNKWTPPARKILNNSARAGLTGDETTERLKNAGHPQVVSNEAITGTRGICKKVSDLQSSFPFQSDRLENDLHDGKIACHSKIKIIRESLALTGSY